MEAFLEALATGIAEESLAGLLARTADAGPGGGALARGALWGVGFVAAVATVRASKVGIRPVLKSLVRASGWVEGTTFLARRAVQEIYREAQVDRRRVDRGG